MYTLYFMPNACSLATQVILRELKQPVRLLERSKAQDFTALNPVGSVPVLVDDQHVLREGAAIILYLLNKHDNTLMPKESEARILAVEDLLFANATVHPAYSKLFFIAENLNDGAEKDKAFSAAAKTINHLWSVVEQKLAQQDFLGGRQISAADILLAVYSRWGQYFPVDIEIGNRASHMLSQVMELDSFKQALQAEEMQTAEIA